jgi:hypothetical protein
MESDSVKVDSAERILINGAARIALTIASELCRERAKNYRARVEYHANPYLNAHAAEADECADDIDALMER